MRVCVCARLCLAGAKSFGLICNYPSSVGCLVHRMMFVYCTCTQWVFAAITHYLGKNLVLVAFVFVAKKKNKNCSRINKFVALWNSSSCRTWYSASTIYTMVMLWNRGTAGHTIQNTHYRWGFVTSLICEFSVFVSVFASCITSIKEWTEHLLSISLSVDPTRCLKNRYTYSNVTKIWYVRWMVDIL